MHGTGSHPEVLLLVKAELSPTDTAAAAAAFHILKAVFSQYLRGEWGVVYDTVSRFKYSKTKGGSDEADVTEYTSLCCYQHIFIYNASHTVIYNPDLFK